MRFKKRTVSARQAFTEAAMVLRTDRESFFEEYGGDILKAIKSGRVRGPLDERREALREMAKTLQLKGIYSSKISPSGVEVMLLKKLFRKDESQRGWKTFVDDTVGIQWMDRGFKDISSDLNRKPGKA